MRVIVSLLFVIVIVSALDDTYQQDFIDNLNDLRSTTNPNAANMRRVEWSDCLAKIAEDYAELCRSPGRQNTDRNAKGVAAGCVPEGSTVGELRILKSTEITDPVGVISAEKSGYNYGKHSCNAICGNYLQAINAETDAVGCYMRDDTNCGGEGYTLICNYAN